MFFAPLSNCPTTFQFVSIQPKNDIQSQVDGIAQKHGLEINVQPQGTFKAPFSSDEYFVQEISLQSSTSGDWESCFQEITQLEEALEEGYFELGN